MDRTEKSPVGSLRRSAVVAAAVLATAAMFVSPAAAQTALDVEITAVDTPRGERLRVSVTGLDAYDGGTLAVYQCGNADASGRAIVPDAGDCIASGAEGYVTRPITGDELVVRYDLLRDGIGVDGARCVPALDGASACQLVVAAVADDDADIVGVPLDDALADLHDGTGAALTPDALPVTGLSGPATAALGGAALLALYIGHLLRSATKPAHL
jgi:hypothetical protein